MLFISIFLLLFSKYSLINSLQCMSDKNTGIFSSSKCEFSLDIKKPIPDDEVLTSTTSVCAMADVDSIAGLKSTGGSCYGEISIDYSTQEMKIKLTGVNSLKSFLDPYDDMLGLYTFLAGKKSVIQYKINGDFENEKIVMITRIQCTTSDNCALVKLRQYLSNLTIIDIRMNRFKELINFLNTPDSDDESSLT